MSGYLSNSGNDSLPKPANAATKLRSVLKAGDGIILCPGVYDGFSARIALGVGFDAIYMVSLHSLRDLCDKFLFTDFVSTYRQELEPVLQD